MKTPIAILISTLMLIGYLAYQHNEDRKYQEFVRCADVGPWCVVSELPAR